MIIDEAHSTQSGETATEWKGVQGGAELRKKAQEMAEEEGQVELERLFRSMAKRGKQPNMSFFVFTAKPKHKTLAIFGRNDNPLHRYTMSQAIEVGFIEDANIEQCFHFSGLRSFGSGLREVHGPSVQNFVCQRHRI